MGKKITVARAISVIGHPFATSLMLVLVGVWSNQGNGRAIGAAVAIAVVFVPVWFFMRNRLATGRWQTIDASAARDRPALFAVGLAAAAGLILFFLYVAPNAEVARGMTVVVAMLCAAAVMNRWIKLSLHLAFAAFAAVILLKLHPAIGVIALLLLPLLAWSRLKLGRHTAWEAAGGVLLGAAMAGIELM